MIYTEKINPLLLKKSRKVIKEIEQQPLKWIETFNVVFDNRNELKEFTKNVNKVIFNGAGTSECIGLTIVNELNKHEDRRYLSVSSPDICTHPDYYYKNEPTCLVSFSRGGSSPESQGAIEHADALIDDIKHLIITCNPNSWITEYALAHKDKTFLLILPEGTYDQSFAMTSSFTCMVLAGYLSFNLDKLDDLKNDIEMLSKAGKNILDNYSKYLFDIVDDFNFEKYVTLGNGNLKALAKESEIKMLEVCAGNLMTWSDTIPGFRHGPAVITKNCGKTLLTIFYENDVYSDNYVNDLIKEIKDLYPYSNNRIIAIGINNNPIIDEYADYFVNVGINIKNSALLAIPYILVVQILMVYKGWKFGIGADLPFNFKRKYGILTKIYPFKSL